ncbi:MULTISPECIES: FadR/GntR family transcriptional regulator [unclassified Luteococcus]|uniref:FadR/GntR family transcriptional regulator n=1 Tax=unclassified Luteococcus TaxID=2639923 RepID=UPI00313B1206
MSSSDPFDPSASPATTTQRAFEAVLEHIETQILEGHLRVGDRLPAERDLATQLQVSRPAVREAIRTLEAQGVLASRVGSGARSGTHVINDRSQALGRLLKLQVALSQFPLNEVVVARIALERSSVHLAAQHPGAPELSRVADLLEQMDQTEDPGEFNAQDTHFHVWLAQMGHNTLVADLTQAVRESMRDPILRAERRMADWPTLRARLAAEHRGIFEAIQAGDGDLAADRVEAHIRGSYSVLPMQDFQS